ncbi:MAG: hypothetical protein WCQ32_03705 [bacterium]
MNTSKILHKTTFIFGLILFIGSIISAILYGYPHFYTWFAVGSWLILDWVDYHKNKTSILGYFYNHKHRITFFLFFFVSTIAAFVIDYVYGVRLSKMWTWPAYSNIDFLRMYMIMNLAYIFGMYELYRVFHTYLKNHISSKHRLVFTIPSYIEKIIAYTGTVVGIIFLILPFISWQHGWTYEMRYIMLLPFLGMWLMSDSITTLNKGSSIFGEIIRGNMLHIVSLTLTGIVATLCTEVVNLYAHEWVYNYMPFQQLNIFKIPVAVFIGWIPLILGVISLLNMIKHIDYIKQKTR